MVAANAPVPAKAPHKHAEAIKAWADGHEIEYFSITYDEWHTSTSPSWFDSVRYRIKPTKPQNRHLDALIIRSPHAGPLLYAAAPDEANCVLVFDGESNKLIKAEVKSPVEAPKQASTAFESMFQGHGSLEALNSLGVR